MHSRLSDFIAARAKETYPEPRTEGHDHITEQMAPIVAALLFRGDVVIDVGCGQGPALKWFTEHGFSPLGISTNQTDVDACRAAGFDARLMDMHDMDFGDAAIDCIWARHVMEHSIAPFFVLHEFARVLTKTGIFYVEVPMPDTPCHHEANPNHYSVMGAQMWLSLIGRAGFEIIEVRSIKLQTGAGPDEYCGIIARKK